MLLHAAALALAGWVFLCAAAWLLQDRLIFPGAGGPAPPIPQGWERLDFRSRDGLPLHALVRSGEGGGVVVLYFHGNGGTAADRAFMFERLPRGIGAVVLAEYRGYGGSPGRPSEAALIDDAEVLFGAAERLSQGAGVVLWGESLGTGVVAALLARGNPAIRRAVLDSPFTSVREVAQGLVPFLPVRPLLRHPFESLERLRGIPTPALVLHAAGDPVVPGTMGPRVVAAMPGAVGHFPALPLHPLALSDPHSLAMALSFAAAD